MGWNWCVLEFLSLPIHCNYYIYPSNSEEGKLLGLFKSSAFCISWSDYIRQLLHSPVSAFPFPEMGGSLESGHLYWQLMLQMMNFSVENVCSLNTTPSPCCTKCNLANMAWTSYTTFFFWKLSEKDWNKYAKLFFMVYLGL